MNRLLTLTLIGLAGLLASCGSSVNSSTQPANTNYAYSMVMSPILFTLNAGDWSSISATVDVSFENGAPKPITPQPTIKFYSSDSRVTISPAGEVCAGQWDVRYLVCTPISPLPTGYVIITAYDATRNVTATAQLSIHPRAANIGLSADPTSTNPQFWPGSSQPWPTNATATGATVQAPCVSQNKQVQYVANPVDGSGNGITSCSVLSAGAGCVNNNDYVWTVADPNVAAVSPFGFVVARNPGVTSVYATLNGTSSAPATFATCPPASIVLGSIPFTSATPLPPFTTASPLDLDFTKGSQVYMTATLSDINGSNLVTAPLNYITTDPLTGSFTTVLPLVAKLTANTSGRFTAVAACEPPNCNNGVPNYTLPLSAATCAALPAPGCLVTGAAAGFGFPIYSNVIGVTVQGTTASSVLVTGTTFAGSATPCSPTAPSGCVHRLEVYDSESLANIQTIELANLPNSLVVAPNGATAYVGSSAGLVVVNLATYQSSLQTYPIVGGLPTDVISGSVLGVSPDSRYVVISDNVSAAPNSYVFLVDTTGSKSATRYTITGTAASPSVIDTVTFAADGSNMWIGGTGGVYVFNSDTFVLTSTNASTGVNALAWMPDGQSYFASGLNSTGPTLTNYSTCNDLNPQTPTPNLPTTVVGDLSTTALEGVPHLLGLDGSEWFDYSVTTSAQFGSPTPDGNVCKSIPVTINTPPATATTTLPCTATQVTFSPRVEAEFVTGVDNSCATSEAVIHGYSVGILATSTAPATPAAAFTLATANATPIVPLSGGVLSDGRKLFVGTYSSTTGTATLHRFDLSTGTATAGTLLDGLLAEDASTSVELVPSFVAVVPK